MEETFNDYVFKKFPTDNKRGTSGVIHTEFGRRIQDCLKNPEAFSTQFRHYVRRRKFRTFDLPSIGLKNVLTIPKPDNKPVDNNSLLNHHYRVVYVEEFYNTIKQIHCDELLHAGYRKTFEKISSMYYGIPRSVVEVFVKMCEVCQKKKAQHHQAPLKPIISNNFLSRLQVDLIDMRHLPDRDFKWILHAIDHWSKFNFAFPLKSKDAESVAATLRSFIFPYFGMPKIFHSDNGGEFVNHVIENLITSWHKDTQIVHGRPRHPQTQGVIERAHRTLEQKLATQLDSSTAWSDLLPRVIYSMNTQVHETTGHSPYELVFGQKPRTMKLAGEGAPSIIKEDDLELDGVVFEDEKDDDYYSHEDLEEDGIVFEDNADDLNQENMLSPIKTEITTTDNNGYHDQLKFKLNDTGTEENKENEKDHNNDNVNANGDAYANIEPIDVSSIDENGNENVIGTEIMDKEIGSTSDDNSASVKHKELRQHARKNFMKAAKKMASRYDKRKAVRFQIGDCASIRIPRIDRTCTDMPRIPCVVVEVHGKAQESYRLRCKYGVINNLYPANELEEYTGKLPIAVDGWKEEKKISLREAASLQSPWNHFIKNACHCTKGCITKRCKCIQNGIKCSTHCHGSKPCHNKLKEDKDVITNECEITYKISDDKEVKQKQSNTSSNSSSSCLSKICQVQPQWLLEAKIGSFKLYDKSFLTLILKNGWVSDEVITAYFHMLVKLNNLTEHVHVMDVNVMSKICDGNFYYDRKRMITLTLSLYDKIIGGYHQSGNHWTLICIKPKAALITYIDPKGENNIFINQLKKNWTTFGNLQYVSGNWKKSVKWNVVTVPHYIQKDSVSCGVLTMNFGEHLILDQPVPTTMTDLYKLRNDMAVQLLNASEQLDDFCRACGLRDTSIDCNADWIKCDQCEWWYHLKCVNKKIKGRNYSMKEAEALNFCGPCCTKDGRFKLT